MERIVVIGADAAGMSAAHQALRGAWGRFPAVATRLKQLPAILGRFNVMVTTSQDNATNFQQANSIPSKGTSVTLPQAQLAGPATAPASSANEPGSRPATRPGGGSYPRGSLRRQALAHCRAEPRPDRPGRPV